MSIGLLATDDLVPRMLSSVPPKSNPAGRITQPQLRRLLRIVTGVGIVLALTDWLLLTLVYGDQLRSYNMVSVSLWVICFFAPIFGVILVGMAYWGYATKTAKIMDEAWHATTKEHVDELGLQIEARQYSLLDLQILDDEWLKATILADRIRYQFWLRRKNVTIRVNETPLLQFNHPTWRTITINGTVDDTHIEVCYGQKVILSLADPADPSTYPRLPEPELALVEPVQVKI